MSTPPLATSTSRSVPPARASHRWSGARVASFLKITEFIDRIGVPLNPVVLMRLLPAVFAVVVACEVMVWGFIVRRAAPYLAADIPAVAGFEDADGTYFLFAVATIPALIDALTHITRLATSTRLEPDPFIQALPSLGVSTRDAVTTFIAVPLVCRWGIFWSPLIVVVLSTANGPVSRLSIEALCFGIAMYAVSAYRRLMLLAWLPVPTPMNWLLTILAVSSASVAGVTAGSTVASVSAALVVSGEDGASTELSVPLAPVLSFLARPVVAWAEAVLGLAVAMIFVALIRRAVSAAPQLYTQPVLRPAVPGRNERGTSAGWLDRLLFPVVGAMWVRVMWSRPSTIATCVALSAATGIALTASRPLPELLPIFVVVPALIAPLAEHFHGVDPRENLLRYRFHTEVGRYAEAGLVLRLFAAIVLGLLPLLLTSSAWLCASDMSPVIGFGPLVAFVFVRSFFANSPIGKDALLTLMVLCELGISYTLAFVSVWSPLAGLCVYALFLAAAFFVLRSRLRKVKL